MREYIGLFRGKRIDNGEWVEGCLLSYEDGRARICARHTDIFCYEKDRSIIQTVAHEVIPDTIGECTGSRDMNRKLIFEGDIVMFEKACRGYIGKIAFNDKTCCLELHWLITVGGYGEQALQKALICHVDDLIIIGNIHDNPELLKGGEG